MGDKNVRAVVGLKLDGADATKQDLKQIQEAAENFGEAGKAAASNLTVGFANVEKGLDKIEAKLGQGKAVTARDVSAMRQQYTLLENNIEKAFGSLEKAPIEIQQAFAKATKQINIATKEVRELDDAVGDSRGTLKEAGASYTGLGDAVQTAAGKHGAMVGKIFLVTAALKEGWQMGRSFVEWSGGGDGFKLLEEMLSNVGQRAGLIIRALSDNIVASLNVVLALFRGDLAEAKRAIGELAQVGSETWGKLGVAFKGTEDEVRKLNGTLKENEAQTKLVAEAQKITEEAAKKLEEAKKKLNDQIDNINKSRAEETKAITEQVTASEDLAFQELEASARMPYLQYALNNATKAYDEQKIKVRELAEMYGDGSPFVVEATDRQRILESALNDARKRYDETKTSLGQYEEAQKKLNASIDQHKEKITELQEKEKEVNAEFEKATGITNEATAATEKAGGAVKGYRDEQGRLKIEMEGGAVAASGLAAGVELVKNAQGQWVIQSKAASEAQKQSTDTIETSATKLTDAANKSKEAFGQINTAAGAAAIGVNALTEAIAKMNVEIAKVATNAAAAQTALDSMSKAGLDDESAGASK